MFWQGITFRFLCTRTTIDTKHKFILHYFRSYFRYRRLYAKYEDWVASGGSGGGAYFFLFTVSNRVRRRNYFFLLQDHYFIRTRLVAYTQSPSTAAKSVAFVFDI